MQWADDGIIIGVRKFSERDALVSLFTRQHGCYRAIAKHALTSKQRGTFEPGNHVHARWNARLAEHMGTLACELLHPVAAVVMQDRMALTALLSCCSLLDTALHERDPHPMLYDRFAQVLEAMLHREDWQKHYLLFERDLLQELGFGLDLSECAATGSTESLIYISPKSGRAVSAEAGQAYHDRMLPLPHVFKDETITPKPAEILDAMRVCGYFLGVWLFEPRGQSMPDARRRLGELIASEMAPA